MYIQSTYYVLYITYNTTTNNGPIAFCGASNALVQSALKLIEYTRAVSQPPTHTLFPRRGASTSSHRNYHCATFYIIINCCICTYTIHTYHTHPHPLLKFDE